MAATRDPSRIDDEARLRVDVAHVRDLIGIDAAMDGRLLVDRFVREAAEKNRKPVVGVSPGALSVLSRHAWPGNIRELRNVVEQMVVFARGPRLEESDVPADIRGASPGEPAGMGALAGHSLEEVEREHIRQTLEATGGNRKGAATRLKIGERTLYRKIERYGL